MSLKPTPGSLRIPRSPCVLLALALILSGCSGPAEESEHKVRREALAGGGERIIRDALPDRPLQAEPIATWDLWGADAPWLFTGIAAITGGTDRYWLLDASRTAVVGLSPEGRLLASISKTGAGPGELRAATWLHWEGDRLWVADVGNNRFSLYDADGAWIEDRPWRAALRLVNAFVPLSDGRVLHAGAWPLTVAELAEEPPTWYLAAFSWQENRSVAAMRAAVDTLIRVPSGGWSAVPLTSVEGAQWRYIGPPILDADLRWTVPAADRVAVASDYGYRFQVLDTAGSVLREVVVGVPSIPMSAAWKRWFIAERLDGELRRTDPFDLDAASRERLPFAEEVPRIAALASDQEGRIWVSARTGEPGGLRTDVFGLDGAFLGSLVDPSTPAAFAAGDLVLLRSPGDWGQDRFRVVRIRF